MTKDEAISAMKEGKKVTHRHFTDKEWISMKDGRILTEDGYNHDAREFWSYRKDKAFEEDWELFHDQEKIKNRAIKFRFWSGEKMFYDFENVMECLKQQLAFDGNIPRVITYDHVGQHKAAFMQFTGKLGHNERELYEGDIVFYEEAGDDGDERHWLVIIWIPEWSMFASVFIDEYLKFLEKGAEAMDEVMFWTYTLQESENYHYAGNIYENKDLLEKHG
jgi:hypothetical protein